MMKVISTAISASVLFGSVAAILGGQTVPINTRNYTTGLRTTIEKDSADNINFCAGALISHYHVLTAASCNVTNAKFVTVGAHYVIGGDDGEEIMVAGYINHPQFDSNTLANDFAILTLTNKSVHDPVKLPAFSELDVSAGMWATAMGWGLTSPPPDGMSSMELLQVRQQVMSEACNALDPTTIDMSQVCASGENGESPCLGDTGGPLIIENGKEDCDDVLIGLISAGDGCIEQGFPAIYARVSSVLPWINSIINAY